MNKKDYENLALDMAKMPFPEWTDQVSKNIKDLQMKVTLANMGLVKRGFKKDGDSFVWDGTVKLDENVNQRSKNYLSKNTAEALSEEQIASWKDSIVLQEVVVDSFVKGQTVKFVVSKMPGEDYAQVFLGDCQTITVGYLTITTDSRSPWIIPENDDRPKFFTYTRYSKPARDTDFMNTIVGWERRPTPKGNTKSWNFYRPDTHEEVLVDSGFLAHGLINEVLKEQFNITPIMVTSASLSMLDTVKILKADWHEGAKMSDVEGVTIELEKDANAQSIQIILDCNNIGTVTFEKGNFNGNYLAKCNFTSEITLNEKLVINAIHLMLGCGQSYRNETVPQNDLTMEVGTNSTQARSQQVKTSEFKPKKGKKFHKKELKEEVQNTAMGDALEKALETVNA